MTETVHIPRIVIAGIHSNCGKTTIARGLMAALVRRGIIVQPFKTGPDFIDPSHHTQICGRISRNLDPVMMGEDEVRCTFVSACQGADIAVIEGVMGMFDGQAGTGEGSTAHVARLLNAPVVLVIPVKGMSGSVHAIAEGFRSYDPAVTMAGVILNMVGSERHRDMLRSGRRVDQLGYIPVSENLQINSRHLGLHMGSETDIPQDLAMIIEEHCDVSALITIAEQAPPIHKAREIPSSSHEKVRVAIANDAAFCFYYQDNLDKLRQEGAQLIFFSPITDKLPDADLIYLGGGYPELYARALESSSSRDQIRKAGEQEMPIYGECGGLMYLGKGLSGKGSETETARWVDLLPIESSMESRFQALGYTTGISLGGPSLAPPGTEIRGHEFHYSRAEPESDARFALTLTRGKGIAEGKDGIYVNNCMGSYTHAYFTPPFARRLIEAALKFQKAERRT